MPQHPVDRYARDVLRGTLPAGPLVRAACQRHTRDRAGTRWRFDAAKASRVIEFFHTFLRLPDTAGDDGQPRPFQLTLWQQFVVGSVFGWVDPVSGYRRFRDAYIESGKGSGKTPLAAGIGLYGLIADGERAAEIYAAAVTHEQARILFRDATHMAEISPALSDRIQRQVGNLAYPATLSFFRPVSSEHRGLDGKRPHMGLLDEIHEHPTAQVVNKIRAGAKGRTQPLFVEITNSGYDRTSVCWEHHEHSRRVVEGQVDDDRWFAYVCGLDEGDDPLVDSTCWPKANPSLGVTIGPDYLARQVANAKNIPAETNTVLRLNFCVWTQASTRFLTSGAWAACAAPQPTAALLGQPCYAGLDLGQTDDFSAFVVIWLLEDGRVAVRSRFWLPEGAKDLHAHRPYSSWERAGALAITPGTVADYDRIEQDILEDARAYGIRQVAYDKRFAAQLAQHLEGAGVTMVDTPQGFYLNAGLRQLSELVISGRLAHDDNQVLAWMADNLVVRTGRDADLRPDKERSLDKIDGMVALVMALSRAQTGPTASVYETRDVLVL